jgi:perosamine synthetase
VDREFSASGLLIIATVPAFPFISIDSGRLSFRTKRGVAVGSGNLTATIRQQKPALLDGPKVRTEPFPSWPITNTTDEEAILETLRSGEWYRGTGQHVNHFEQAYKRLTGARNCLATANGTGALYVALNGIGIEPGDEILVPPYTFIATINAVLRQFALPRRPMLCSSFS